MPKNFPSQPATFSSRSCLHPASVGVCKPSKLGETCCVQCSLAVFPAKELAEYVVRLSLHLGMLLLSAAEAVDHPEELVTINMHLFFGRCDSAELAPHLASGQGDLLNAILGHTGHCLQSIGWLQEGRNSLPCKTTD